MTTRLTIVLTIFIAVEIAAGLYLTCIPNAEIGLTCSDSKTSLFSFIMSPQDWTASDWINWIKDNLFTLGGAAVIVAGLLVTRLDWLVYLGISLVWLGYGQILYYLQQQLSNVGFFGDAGSVIAFILLGTIWIYTLITIIDWARSPS